MTKRSTEKRLTKVEQQVVARVNSTKSAKSPARRTNESDLAPLVSRDKWKQTLGVFGPEDGMDQVFDAAMKLRKQNQKKSRQATRTKSTRIKPLRRRKLVET